MHCMPGPVPTPFDAPGRLDAEGKRLNAMLQAVRAVRPALEDFYGSLSADQKARFDTIGRQLLAKNG